MMDVAQVPALHSLISGLRLQGAGWAGKARREIAIRRTQRALSALPDEILSDLGLERGQLRTAARRAAASL